jgi:MFS family permease
LLKDSRRFFGELDRRVRATLVSIGIYNWAQQLTYQYNVLYANSLGANGIQIGLLNGLSAIIASISSVPIGPAVEKYSIKKIMLLGITFDIISVTICILAGNWWMLIPVFILHGKLIRVIPLADVTFTTFTEPHRRSTVMGLSRLVWGILNVFTPIAAAVIVADFGGINAQGIRPLYYVEAALYAVAFFILAKGMGTTSSIAKGEESGSTDINLIQHYREFFKDGKYLKRWIAIRIVRDFAVGLSVAFIPLWMVNVKGATPYIFGTSITLSVVIFLFLSIPAGRLADKIGRKKTFYLLTPFYYLGTILLISAPNPECVIIAAGLLGAGIGGVGGAGGGIGGVAFTPFITMFWETAPPEKRGRWFGLEGLIAGLVTLPASIIAGILWEQGLMTEVLLIPILLQALVVIPMLSTVPDTLISKPKR